jgi:TetR/AcrR family tetracycline transcriptional repressor
MAVTNTVTEASTRVDTRGRILDAARDLILDQHPAALTVAAIAAAAGVSARTIYRYFPTKEELIAAVAERPTEGVPGMTVPEHWNEVRGALRVVWRFFAEDMNLLRSERLIPGGVELRRARLATARPAFDRVLADAGVPEGPERAVLVEIVIHLTSSTTLLELIDRHGLSVDAATDMVLDTLDRIVESARDSE